MKKFVVQLAENERKALKDLCSKGKHSARRLKKANILLQADMGLTDTEIAANLFVGHTTIERTRQRYVEGSIEHALNDASRSGRPKLITGSQECALIALACTKPPEGRSCWTALMLAKQMIHLGVVEDISEESVRLLLKKTI